MKKQKAPELKELKKLLHRKNISYKRLSKRLNISVDAVNNKLNGYTLFNSIEILKISQFLNIEKGNIFKYFWSDCNE